MSRTRSATARGASPAGRASGGRPGVFVQAPRSDIYVGLLGLSLAAIVVACILLALIMNRYEFQTKAAWTVPQAETQIAANLEKVTILDSVRL